MLLVDLRGTREERSNREAKLAVVAEGIVELGERRLNRFHALYKRLLSFGLRRHQGERRPSNLSVP